MENGERGSGSWNVVRGRKQEIGKRDLFFVFLFCLFCLLFWEKDEEVVVKGDTETRGLEGA